MVSRVLNYIVCSCQMYLFTMVKLGTKLHYLFMPDVLIYYDKLGTELHCLFMPDVLIYYGKQGTKLHCSFMPDVLIYYC